MTESQSSTRTPHAARCIYPWLAASTALFVFAGFARSYYLHALFEVQAPTPFLTLHGTVMSGWIVLLLIQTGLIAIHERRWHMRLGWAAAFYVPLMMVLRGVATVSAAAREVRAHSAFANSQLDVSR